MQAGLRAEVETRMKRLYVRLSEKDRRWYAAVEADKLGHGGFEYIAKLFEIDPKTIRQGLKDLEEELDPAGGIGKKGCRSRLTDHPEWGAVFLAVVREHTAGNPQHGVIWTDLKPREIAQAMTSRVDARVSVRTVRQLLKSNGFSRRQSQKKKSFKSHAQRDAQFQRITQLKAEYLEDGQPVISIDTKMLARIFRAEA